MNYLKQKILYAMVSSVVVFSQLFAQNEYSLESQLRNILIQGYGESYLKGYMQPFATAFGTAMGGAVYHRAYTKNFPHFDLGVSGVYMRIPDEAKTFNYNGDEVSTFFGPNEPGSTGITGSNLESIVLSQIQLNLGLFSNFEVMLRGRNIVPIKEIGDINLLGLGMKYDISDLLPATVPDLYLSAQAIYQTLNVCKWLRSATFGMNVQASKDIAFLPLGIYAGIGFEITSLKIKTDYIPDIGSYGIGDVSIEGENKFRLTIGLSLNLTILNVHADYNIGTYDSIAGGLMVAL